MGNFKHIKTIFTMYCLMSVILLFTPQACIVNGGKVVAYFYGAKMPTNYFIIIFMYMTVLTRLGYYRYSTGKIYGFTATAILLAISLKILYFVKWFYIPTKFCTISFVLLIGVILAVLYDSSRHPLGFVEVTKTSKK